MLFLQKWAPAWALAHAFENDVMTIHRLTTRMGRYNMVGTTVKQPDTLPKDVGADDTHTTMSGEKAYCATTVAEQCFLGASMSGGAGEEELTDAYRQFQHEAQQIQPDYQPETVNTDGWHATMNAWRTLFPSICLIQCFLHAILSIRHVATKATKALYTSIVEQARERVCGNDQTELFTTAPTTSRVGGDADKQLLENQIAEALSEQGGISSGVRFSPVFTNAQYD